LAELIFDSFHQPVPAGARSSVASSRQLLYRSAGLDIDIQTHFHPDSNRVFLTGQVLDSSNPNANMKDISVMLADERGMLAQTVTNTSGEFQVEFDPCENAWLKIDRREKPAIVMVLGNLEPKRRSMS
jgi:hypothetical protein